MECPACMKWLAVPMTIALMANFWLGCSQSDMNGYRPANSHAPTSVSSDSAVLDQAMAQKESTWEGPSKTLTVNAEDKASSASGDSMAPEVPASALLPVNVVDGANIRAVLSVPASNSQPSLEAENSKPEMKAATEPRKVEVLVKEKAFRAEPKTGALRVSFDDLDLLKVLNMEPVVDNAQELMPDWLRGLDGKAVRIRGFMYPTYDTEGIEHFVLARDNQICCFGRDPKIYDLIQIDMKAGKTTNYIPATRAFDVIGKFRIQMQSEDGKPYGLYVIDQAEVIDR